MYAMICTRPDFVHAVGVLSRYMEKIRKEHWTIEKECSNIYVAQWIVQSIIKESLG